jgi:hypothetical protein
MFPNCKCFIHEIMKIKSSMSPCTIFNYISFKYLKNKFLTLAHWCNLARYRISPIVENWDLWTRKFISCTYYRYGVSDYAAAALANGLLKDFGIITPTDRVEVLDPSKISREKRRISAASICERSPELTELKCIGLDSKRDANALVIQRVQEGEEIRAYKTSTTLDNLSFTVESGRFFTFMSASLSL